MERQKRDILHCPICNHRVNITIDLPKAHPVFRSANCSNEAFAHVGFTLYRVSDILEGARLNKRELILN